MQSVHGCIIPILVLFLSTSPISLFLLTSHFYPYSLAPDIALSFEFSAYTVNESISSILVVNVVKEPRDAETETTYVFSVRATGVTATAGEDFTTGVEDEQIFIPITPLQQQQRFFVRIFDDALIEGNETFQLELLVAEQPYFLLGSITRATVTIMDDDRREDEGKGGREGRTEGGRKEGGERGRRGRVLGREEGRKVGRRKGG